MLVALVHPGGSRISLAVDRTTAKDASALVEQNKPGLMAQGLRSNASRPARATVSSGSAGRSRSQALRQLYVVAQWRAAATNARPSW